MKHEYLTCDRCGKKISRKLPRTWQRVNLMTKYPDPQAINLETEMSRLQREIKNMTYDYSVDVDIVIGIREGQVDLCHKCGKELMRFLKRKEGK